MARTSTLRSSRIAILPALLAENRAVNENPYVFWLGSSVAIWAVVTGVAAAAATAVPADPLTPQPTPATTLLVGSDTHKTSSTNGPDAVLYAAAPPVKKVVLLAAVAAVT